MREFAKKSNVSNAYISLIESEDTKSPTLEMISKLASGMKMQTNDLINLMNDEEVIDWIKCPKMDKIHRTADYLENTNLDLNEEKTAKLHNYELLNSQGLQKVQDYLNDLIKIEEYRK